MTARTGETASSGLRISEKLRRAASQPCAIVGMACRLPGAPDLDKLRDLLRAGREGIAEAPANRWDGDEFAAGQPGAPGQLITRRGGFVEQFDQFASDFFDISPREAAAMDPQQRLLLEVTWEALEAAGIPPPSLARTRTSVFVGVSAHDAAKLRSREAPDGFTGPGSALSVAAGRISYVLDLRGPCLAIDTSCSSSLVGLHQAWASLQRGESDAALVCGVNILLDPRVSVALAQSGMLSRDGRCKTFDDTADGYVRSEGCIALVLKRLRDAERDGDPVLAILRGTAVNHDGRTQGLTAPSGVAQRAVIRQALAEAGVGPGDVQVLEAHGTGTSLGDPQELDAIGDVFAERDRRLVVGSIKTNLGHLEAVAGLAGVVKLVLGLQHREIYPHLHLRRTNGNIPLADLPLSIPTELRPWPAAAAGRSRIGVVSSFGFSGTNAHVVLEEPPRAAPPAAAGTPALPSSPSPLPLAFSARSETELRALAARHAAHLRGRPGLELADLCYSAATARADWSHRCAVPVRDRDALARDLDQVAGGKAPAGALFGQVRRGPPPKIAFLFTGQGSQHPGMAAGLFAAQPVFRAALERCAELFRAELPLPLTDVIFGSSAAATAALDDTLYTQPALFATGWALAQLWRSCGVEPAVVLGHSVGEITAACVSGAIQLEDAARFVAARARLMQEGMAEGAMLAVLGPVDAAEAAVARRRDELSIAAYNGPSLAVVSGKPSAVADVEAELAGRGVRTRRLRTSRAFHSPLVQPILGAIERAGAALRPAAPACRLASNVSGSLFAAGDAPTGAYWAHQARQPVRFADNLRAAFDHGCTVLLELGPDPVLIGMSRAVEPEGVVSAPSLRRGTPDQDAFLHAAAALHVKGAPIRWEALDPRPVRRRVPLPSYPFARRRFALPRRTAGESATHASPGSAPLASPPVPAAGRELALQKIALDLPVDLFELHFAGESPGILADHRVGGATVIPAAALVELMLSAARGTFGAGRARLEQVTFTRPLIARPEQIRRALVSLSRSGRDAAAVQVASQLAGEAWTPHAEARFSLLRDASPSPDATALELLRAALDQPAPVDELYGRLAERGLEYGPRFRGLVEAFPGDAGLGEALGRVAVPAAARLEEAWLHPVLLDSAFHLAALSVGTLDADPSGEPEVIRVPAGIDQIEIAASVPLQAWAHARARRDGQDIRIDIDLRGDAGERLAVVRGLRLTPFAPVAEHDVPSLPSGEDGEESTILTRLASAPAAERVALLIEFIRLQVAGVMKMELEEVEDSPDLLLIELGFDSLMAVELQRRLQAHLRFSMPPGADMGGFNYSTIGDLATLLLSRVIDLSST